MADLDFAPEATRSLDELCALAQVPKRTVRYYIQMGLLDRPVGETRAARYSDAHLRRLLRIKQMTSAGFSLDRIRERLEGPLDEDVHARPAGTVEQWTRLVVDHGLELSVDPDRASLSPGQVRALFRDVLRLYADIKLANGSPARATDE